MKAVTKILAGGIGFAALAGAAPAAAQYYPGYGYGYGNNGGLGAIIEAILGAQRYGQPYGYGYNQNQERFLVEQCARATESQIQRRYGGYGSGYGGYGQPYGGYGQGYGYNAYTGARILNITRLERRRNGGLKIYGIATSGRATAYGNPYGGYNAPYGGGYGQYGYGANAAADLRFDCTIDYRGRVTDVDISRNRYY